MIEIEPVTSKYLILYSQPIPESVPTSKLLFKSPASFSSKRPGDFRRLSITVNTALSRSEETFKKLSL